MSKKHLTKVYLILVICIGATICFWEIYSFPTKTVNLHMMLLALITILIGKRLSISVPNIEGGISPTGTFIFVTLLVYGENAAVLLAAAEGISQHIKNKQKLLFNTAVTTISTFSTAWLLRLLFSEIPNLSGDYWEPSSIVTICFMGFSQFVVNSSLTSFASALNLNHTIKKPWRQVFLHFFIIYLTSAFAAGILVMLAHTFGLLTVLVVVPTFLVLCFALYTYTKNSNEQVRQAMLRVEELNRYIAEQEGLRELFARVKGRETPLERISTQNITDIRANNLVKYDGILVKGDSGSLRHLRAFLCHSSDDKPVVRDLYYRLRDDGVDAWLDHEHLLPGQDWEHEISKAVRRTDLVIVCLSRNTINKVGYVQKEIKFALDVAEQQPEGSLFIVPLKLEDCDVPDRLSRWQWVNFFEEGGYERLVRALRYSANMLSSR